MGFQVRKRSKGKTGWLNFSYSEKNGLGISVSAKAGPFTWNSGNGKSTRRRLTTDLGNGVRHVSYAKKGKQTNQPAIQSSPAKPWDKNDTLWLVWSVIGVVVAASLFGFWGFVLSVFVGMLWMFIKVNWYD